MPWLYFLKEKEFVFVLLLMMQLVKSARVLKVACVLILFFIKWMLKYDEPLPLEGETICLRRNKVHQFVLVIPWVIGPSPFNGDCSVQQGAWHTALEGGQVLMLIII